MIDQDKTDKVIPLSELLRGNEEQKETLQQPGTPLVHDDVVLATGGVFRRFALWILRSNR